MKTFTKLIFFVIVAAVAGPFFIAGPNGKPLLSLDKLHAPDPHLPDFNQALDGVKDSLGEDAQEQAAKPREVFRWQDAGGTWHYSDSQEQGQAAEIVTLNPESSMVHLEPVKTATIEGNPTVEKDAQEPASGLPFPTTISLEKIPKLITDAKNIGNLQRQHMDRQQRAMQVE